MKTCLFNLSRSIRSLGIAALGICIAHGAHALDIPGAPAGSPSATNDRFSSGYPSAPVPNTSGSFVGLGYDFSGVGWNLTDSSKSFGLLSPKNYLVARHYGGAPTIEFFGGDGQLHTYTEQSLSYTNYGTIFSNETTGDTAIGTLTAPIKASDQIQSYAVLDSTNYVDAPVLIYGHGNNTPSPRVAATSIAGEYITDPYESFVLTSNTDSTYQIGDSGSPAFIPWTDPTGGKQMTIMGNAAGVGSGYNWLNFIQRPENITALNSVMVPGGYALRWVADATATWKGGAAGLENSFGSGTNWTSGTTSDGASYLAFTSSNTTQFSIDLGHSTHTARGLIFDPSTSGFTFSSGTLLLDRGGLNNFDTHQETFTNSFLLTDHQFWDGHAGGFDVSGTIDTNGKLLIVQGSAASTLSGRIFGAGSLAKDGSGILTLSGSNSFTGPTFLHNGILLAKNATGFATGTGTVTVEAGTLSGFGTIGGNTTINAGAEVGGGDIVSGGISAPDLVNQSKNLLKFAGNLTLNGALDFHLGALSETIGYTGLQLSNTGAQLSLGNTASFTLSSTSFVGIADPNSGLPFWDNPHSWTLIDVAGSTPDSGVFASVSLGVWNQGTFALNLNAGSGANDVQLQYSPKSVPEPSTGWLLLSGIAGAFAFVRGRRVRA